MTQWIKNLGPDVPVHFTAFHPDYRMRNKPRTPPRTLIQAWRIARENGIRYVYTGNIYDKPTGSTYCHNCGLRLIGRDWHLLDEWGLTQSGLCSRCGTPCAGEFEDHPGDWGRKRQPVRLEDFAARLPRDAEVSA